MEARRSTTLERGNAHDALFLGYHVLQRIGHSSRTFDTRTRRHVNLDGKLITVGEWHQLLRYALEHQDANYHARHTTGNGYPGMIEAPVNEDLVVLVHEIEQVERLLAVGTRLHLHRFPNEEVLQDGQQRLGDNHRGKEHNGDGPREGEQEVVHLSRHHEEEGEEGHRDTQRSGED